VGKRIVIALGGNALGQNLPEQMAAVQGTSNAIVDLIAQGHEVVVTHGNGPQVGMILMAFEAASMTYAHSPVLPMSVCVALSQGYIGYDLQNALREALLNRGIDKPVATLITQVVVDEKDAAFDDPVKPIGSFFSKDDADAMSAKGARMKEDAGRGWRRVVASPRPVDVVEKDTVRLMLDAGQVVVTAGGGGIPVIRQGNHLKGVSAVVDKDWASAKLAEMIDADLLVILTAVEKVAIGFGKPDERWLDRLGIEQAERYLAEGQFAEGSMRPKIEAALDFARSRPGRKTLITLLAKARDGIEGRTGTVVG
jgi:carbamate kinase